MAFAVCFVFFCFLLFSFRFLLFLFVSFRNICFLLDFFSVFFCILSLNFLLLCSIHLFVSRRLYDAERISFSFQSIDFCCCGGTGISDMSLVLESAPAVLMPQMGPDVANCVGHARAGVAVNPGVAPAGRGRGYCAHSIFGLFESRGCR